MSRDTPEGTHGFGICVKGGKDAGTQSSAFNFHLHALKDSQFLITEKLFRNNSVRIKKIKFLFKISKQNEDGERERNQISEQKSAATTSNESFFLQCRHSFDAECFFSFINMTNEILILKP